MTAVSKSDRLTSGALVLWLLVMAMTTAAACGESIQADDSAETAPPSGPGGKADDASRAAWVVSEITRWNAWLSDEDRVAKYDKMAESSFVFFRGTNHLFWADLASDPRLSAFGDSTTITWLQGDLHLENYGAFCDDDGRIVYDLNDFDESVIGDYQLDVWRMATAITLVGRQNGLDDDDVRDAVDAFSEAYLDALADFRGNDDELDRTVTEGEAYGRLDEFLDEVEHEESRRRMLDRWTTHDGGPQTLDTGLDDLEAVDAATADALAAALENEYSATLSGGLAWDPDYFAVKGVARRLRAGTGSLGTPRFYVLIEGPSGSDDDDVILDVKRQGPPTAWSYLDAEALVWNEWPFASHAERVVIAQKALLTDVDDHLGWLCLEDGCYSVRERSPYKESFPFEELTSVGRLEKLAEQWGTILATDHARADRDFSEDLIPWSFERQVDELTDGRHAEFRDRVWDVASSYADQVARDYETFLAAF